MEPQKKMAAWSNFTKVLPEVMAEHAVGAAAHGLVGAAGAGVGLGAMKLFQAATKARDFRQMLEYNPDLAQHHEADPKMFNQMYTSLRRMNPTYAADPIVAGTFMRQMAENPNHAGDMLTTALSGAGERSPIVEGMIQGAKKGPLSPSRFSPMPVIRPAPTMRGARTSLWRRSLRSVETRMSSGR